MIDTDNSQVDGSNINSTEVDRSTSQTVEMDESAYEEDVGIPTIRFANRSLSGIEEYIYIFINHS